MIGTLELLVAENYMIVYLNGATSRRKMPSVGWLRKCYQQIDRRSVWQLSESVQKIFEHCLFVSVYFSLKHLDTLWEILFIQIVKP